MAKQGTFETGGFERFRKATWREKFLAEMDAGVPWDKLMAVIERSSRTTPGIRGGKAADHRRVW